MGNASSVSGISVDSRNNVLLGGSFANVNGTNWPGLARLRSTGALDTNFNPGSGVNGTVYSLAVQSPGNQIVIGGSFSQVNHTNLNNIRRLSFNGSVDYSFGPGSGINGPVYSVAVQSFDGKIVAGGLFDTVSGVRRQDLVRFLTNGWVDTSFMDTAYNQFAGLVRTFSYDTPEVFTSGVQSDGNVMIGGSFNQVGGGQFGGHEGGNGDHGKHHEGAGVGMHGENATMVTDSYSHPIGRPLFCSSSQAWSGLKYSTIARVEISSPVASRSTFRQSCVAPFSMMLLRNAPTCGLPR